MSCSSTPSSATGCGPRSRRRRQTPGYARRVLPPPVGWPGFPLMLDVRWFRSAAARLPTMGEVQVVQVDERDSGWENSRPRFRVYLHGSGPKSTYGWTDTYDVTGADVLQVIDWAQRQAGDSLTYAVALVHDDPARGQMDPGSGRGLVWLVGMDGNTNPINPEEAETLDRMLARRREAVGVPLADRMPAGAPDPYNDGTQRR